MASWRPGTQKQYTTYIRKWIQYCGKRKINHLQANVSDVVDFLSELFHKGLSYSALNTARSSLSAIGLVVNGFTIGSHPLVIKLLRGVFNLRPSKPKYCDTWDVSIVLSYLKHLPQASELSLKLLTLKLSMLLALVLAGRSQSLHLLCIDNMRKESSSYTLFYSGLLKQSKPGKSIPCVELCAYAADKSICVYTMLTEYLKRTMSLRGDINSLFISYIKPFGRVSKATVSRWIKTVMNSAGINCDKYKPHSVRAASASKAKAFGVPIDDILKVAGWSNMQTFAMFYNKPVDNATSSSNRFSNAVLTD
ncbi:MAG: tyrosine-type recombinase/integrase [Sedimenticola sp.]